MRIPKDLKEEQALGYALGISFSLQFPERYERYTNFINNSQVLTHLQTYGDFMDDLNIMIEIAIELGKSE